MPTRRSRRCPPRRTSRTSMCRSQLHPRALPRNSTCTHQHNNIGQQHWEQQHWEQQHWEQQHWATACTQKHWATALGNSRANSLCRSCCTRGPREHLHAAALARSSMHAKSLGNSIGQQQGQQHWAKAVGNSTTSLGNSMHAKALGNSRGTALGNSIGSNSIGSNIIGQQHARKSVGQQHWATARSNSIGSSSSGPCLFRPAPDDHALFAGERLCTATPQTVTSRGRISVRSPCHGVPIFFGVCVWVLCLC